MAKEGNFRPVRLPHSGGERGRPVLYPVRSRQTAFIRGRRASEGSVYPQPAKLWQSKVDQRLGSALMPNKPTQKKMSPIASSASTTAPIGLRVVRVGQSGARRLRAEHSSKKPSAVS